jgi:hypothetical protein
VHHRGETQNSACAASATDGKREHERIVLGDVVFVSWAFQSFAALPAEEVLGRLTDASSLRVAPGVRLDVSHAQVTRLWSSYLKAVASKQVEGTMDTRLVVRFLEAGGVERWLGLGKGQLVVQTDDRACHAVSPDVLADILGALPEQVRADIKAADPVLGSIVPTDARASASSEK